MRIIENESKPGAYVMVILGLISAYFGFYILTGILFFTLMLWLFFCSSKLINPTSPSAIVSPINGVIDDVKYDGQSVEFTIISRFNGRIYAPCDLHETKVKKCHGFYFMRNSELSNQIGVCESMLAKTVIEDENLVIEIEIRPRLFSFCSLHSNKTESLFLEKIGFLNVGSLQINIKGNNLKVIAKKNEKVMGGISQLIRIENL